MEIVLYIYFAINLTLVGSYALDVFNEDRYVVKTLCSVLLLFFGAILVLYEFIIADRVERWWNKFKRKYATKKNN